MAHSISEALLTFNSVESKLEEILTKKSRGLTVDIASSIRECFQETRGIILSLQLDNAHLDGQLSESRKDFTDLVAGHSLPNSTCATTFADAVKSSVVKKPPPFSLVISDTKQKTPATEIQSVLDKHIAPQKIGLKIQQVVRAEDKLIIKVNTESQAALLKSQLTNKKFNRYEVREGSRRLPAAIIFNVPQRRDTDAVLGTLQELGDFKVRTQLKARDPHKSHWVIEGEPAEIDNLVVSQRVCIGFSNYLVKLYYSVQRCFNCQRIGHTSRRCKFQRTCASCGEFHDPNTECTSEALKCTNCVHHNRVKGTKWRTDHPAYSRQCLSFKEAVKTIQAGGTWSNPVDIATPPRSNEKIPPVAATPPATTEATTSRLRQKSTSSLESQGNVTK